MKNMILKTQVAEAKMAFQSGHKFGLTWLPYFLRIFNHDEYRVHCQENDFVKNQWIKMAKEYADSVTSGCYCLSRKEGYLKTIREILDQSQCLEGWVDDLLGQIKLSTSDIPDKFNGIETGWACSICGNGLHEEELGYSIMNMGEPLCFDHLQKELFDL